MAQVLCDVVVTTAIRPALKENIQNIHFSIIINILHLCYATAMLQHQICCEVFDHQDVWYVCGREKQRKHDENHELQSQTSLHTTTTAMKYHKLIMMFNSIRLLKGLCNYLKFY